MDRLEYIAEVAKYGRISNKTLLKKEVDSYVNGLLSKTTAKFINDDYIRFYYSTYSNGYADSLFFIYKRKHSHIIFNDSDHHNENFNILYTLKYLFLLKKEEAHAIIRPMFKKFLSNIDGVNYCTPDRKIKFADNSFANELMRQRRY